MYTLMTFQCYECGMIHTVMIRDNHDLAFSTEVGLHSEKQCLTKSGYFKCIECKTISNTIKFEKVYN